MWSRLGLDNKKKQEEAAKASLLDHPKYKPLAQKLRLVFSAYPDLSEWLGYGDGEHIYNSLRDLVECQGLSLNTVKVKLVVINLDFWQKHAMLATLVNRFFKPEFGLVHTALQVGPALIHWFDCSLVLAKELKSNDVVLALDLGSLDLTGEQDQHLRKMAGLMSEWNRTKQYNVLDASCHHFVQAAVETLGFELPNDSAAANFFAKLQDNGIATMSHNGTIFTSHAQLDAYVTKLKEMGEIPPGDDALLKAFDRAFWYRHNVEKEDKDQSFHQHASSNCPYGDPADTATFPPEKKKRQEEWAELLRSNDFSEKVTGTDDRPIRVLAVDGGGMRGVITLRVLQAILDEASTIHGKQLKLRQVFDLVAGTSTGGILAAALGLDQKTTAEADALYRTLGKEVFGTRFGGPTLGVKTCFNYDHVKLRSLIEENISGELLLSQLHDHSPKIFVVSTRHRPSPGRRTKPYIFRTYKAKDDQAEPTEGQAEVLGAEPTEAENYEDNLPSYDGTATGKEILLTDALMATSAAPGYFPHVTIQEHKFTDGGMVQNNPAMIALIEASRLWPRRRIVLVSLGTGKPILQPERSGASWSDSASHLVQIPIGSVLDPVLDLLHTATNSEATHEMLQMLCSDIDKLTYQRLNPPCEPFNLAACAEKDLDTMTESTEEWLAMNTKRLQKVAASLALDKGLCV